MDLAVKKHLFSELDRICGDHTILATNTSTLAVVDRGGISRLLDLPEHVVPMAIVPLGWPTRPLGPPRREPVEAKIHREVFGNPW